VINILQILWVIFSNLSTIVRLYKEAKAQGKVNEVTPKIREAFREKNADKLNQYFNS